MAAARTSCRLFLVAYYAGTGVWCYNYIVYVFVYAYVQNAAINASSQIFFHGGKYRNRNLFLKECYRETFNFVLFSLWGSGRQFYQCLHCPFTPGKIRSVSAFGL